MVRIASVEIPAGSKALLMTLAVFGVWLGACATAPDAVPIAKPRVVLLAPTSFDSRLSARLEAGATVVDELLGHVLWRDDVEVHRTRGALFRDAWLAAARSAATDSPGGDRHDRTVYALVQDLQARGARFDALVIPYLTLRRGSVYGHSVHWDGVTRRLPLDPRQRDAGFLLARRGVEAPCTSLRVIAYDARGVRLFEGLGGLEVASRLHLDGGRGSLRERSDLFQDAGALRDGVHVALRPLLRR
jgi:hypothetical protein